MGIYATKTRWQQAVQPLVGFAVRHKIHPDLFTAAALVLSLLAALGLGLAGGQRAWLWLVPPCAILRLVFNLLDGQVARALGLADAWGEAKNEFGDRVADAAIFLGMALGGYADARLAALVLALVLGASCLGTFNVKGSKRSRRARTVIRRKGRNGCCNRGCAVTLETTVELGWVRAVHE